MICDIFNTKVNSSLALIRNQGLPGTALSIQIVPLGFEQTDHLQLQVLPGDHKLHLLIDYLSSVTSGEWYNCYGEKLQDFTTFWSDFICKIVKRVRKI